jgi:hypothetical protein
MPNVKIGIGRIFASHGNDAIALKMTGVRQKLEHGVPCGVIIGLVLLPRAPGVTGVEQYLSIASSGAAGFLDGVANSFQFNPQSSLITSGPLLSAKHSGE